MSVRVIDGKTITGHQTAIVKTDEGRLMGWVHAANILDATWTGWAASLWLDPEWKKPDGIASRKIDCLDKDAAVVWLTQTYEEIARVNVMRVLQR